VFLADVVGTVVAPIQIPLFDGEKLLLVRPISPSGQPSASARIGVDRAQAGVGDRVLVMDEGNSARQLMDAPEGAVRTVVVSVVDTIEMGGETVFDQHTAPDVLPLARLQR